MITENVSTLKIHNLTQAQYDREAEAGTLEETSIYLTPDEEIEAPIIYLVTTDEDGNVIFGEGQNGVQLYSDLQNNKDVTVIVSGTGGKIFFRPSMQFITYFILTSIPSEAFHYKMYVYRDGDTVMEVDITSDYVIEQGTSGIWTYRKWASGIAECWGNTSISTYNDNRSLKLFETLPVSFTTISSVQLTDLGQTVNYIQQKQHILSYEAFGSNQLMLMAVFDDGGVTDGQSIKVSIDVKGMWE